MGIDRSAHAYQSPLGRLPHAGEAGEIERQELHLLILRLLADLLQDRPRAIGGAAGEEDLTP